MNRITSALVIFSLFSFVGCKKNKAPANSKSKDVNGASCPSEAAINEQLNLIENNLRLAASSLHGGSSNVPSNSSDSSAPTQNEIIPDLGNANGFELNKDGSYIDSKIAELEVEVKKLENELESKEKNSPAWTGAHLPLINARDALDRLKTLKSFCEGGPIGGGTIRVEPKDEYSGILIQCTSNDKNIGNQICLSAKGNMDDYIKYCQDEYSAAKLPNVSAVVVLKLLEGISYQGNPNKVPVPCNVKN